MLLHSPEVTLGLLLYIIFCRGILAPTTTLMSEMISKVTDIIRNSSLGTLLRKEVRTFCLILRNSLQNSNPNEVTNKCTSSIVINLSTLSVEALL